MSSTTKIIALEGKYKRLGQKLLPERENASHYFIIGTRATQTKKKAHSYLVLFIGSQKRYFSSLYPSEKEPQTFFAECEGVIYKVHLTPHNSTLKKEGYV